MLIPIPSWLRFATDRLRGTVPASTKGKVAAKREAADQLEELKDRARCAAIAGEYETILRNLRKFFLDHPHLLKQDSYPDNYRFFKRWYPAPSTSMASSGANFWDRPRLAQFHDDIEELSV